MAGRGPLSGSTFSKRYELGDRIGVGGMAEVYTAQDLVLGRVVAVKTMLPQYASDPDFTRRFRQEAAAAANLQSPYIVNVYDWGHDGDNYFIVMEYVRGSDLKTAIKERGAINERKVAEIASQVCQALSAAHKQDIIHRDVKPQNIMIQPDGNVKVMDFGIARAKNSTADKTETVLGTAHYTSPEQAQGKDLTAASDIYSLGVVMYEAATGTLPFDGPDAVSVALMQVQDEPKDPRELNPKISPDFAAIILTAMSKDPNERFATANEMRIALNDFLSGRTPKLPMFAAGAAAGAAAGVIGARAANAYQGNDDYSSARTSVMQPVDNRFQGAGIDSTQVLPITSADSRYGHDGTKPPSGGKSYMTSNTPDAPSGGSGKGKIVAACIVAALIVAAAICAVIFLGGGGEKAAVPNVVGLTSEEAVTAIEESGFKVGKVTNTKDETVEPGTVIRQTPQAGTEAEKDSAIDIVVSQGSGKLDIPDVRGLSRDQARQTLITSGFTLGTVTEEYSSDVSAGSVISQNPAGGTQAEKGTAVDLVVSKGEEEFDVPDLRGLTESQARFLVQSAGFTLAISGSDYSDTVEEGSIISQSPSANSTAPKGSTISCVVSLGPDEVTVPNVVGKTASAAQSELASAGFIVNVTEQRSTIVPQGNVISQSPSGGTVSKHGVTVTIEVSSGTNAPSSSSAEVAGGN